MIDRIVAGNKVSFALPIPGATRTFGTVYRVARSKTGIDYGVKDQDGQNRLIPARFITKEC